MNFPPPLSESQLKLVAHFRTHGGEKHYAVARRQRWDALVPIIDQLTEKLLLAQRDAAAYQYLATGLHLAGTGYLTETQVDETVVLSEAQKADCRQLARLYDRQRPRLLPGEPPAPGQRITAKFKPDSFIGKAGSWHAGVVTTGIGADLFISIAGFSLNTLDDISQWVPCLDETEADVEIRQYWKRDRDNYPSTQ